MLFQKRGRIAFAVFNAVFLALATAVFVFALYCAVSLITLPEIAPDTDWNTSLGVNLSRGFLSVFLLLAVIANGIVFVIGEIFSVILCRKTDGGLRIFGIVSIGLHGVYIAVGLIFSLMLL